MNNLGWMEMLVETYDTYQELVGIEKNEQPILLPISHSTVNAQIEVVIDAKGRFIRGKLIEKGDEMTIIPVTEDSASRGNGNFPHSLCDKLCYVAGDYSFYATDGNIGKKEYYKKYMKQLADWVAFSNHNSMLEAIFLYLQQETLIYDLVNCGILKLNERGKLTDEKKLQGVGQTGAVVRFQVYLEDTEMEESRVWKNKELYENYIRYYDNCLRDKDLCYVSGKIEKCTYKHPSKIRYAADKAKLISGNDETGFTYRGRFVDNTKALSVGYESSQKAHNALKWLLQKQGYQKDGMAFVSWVVNRDIELPNISRNSVDSLKRIILQKNKTLADFLGEEKQCLRYGTGKQYAEKLNKAMQGYEQKIKEDDRVVMLVLDAETEGRVSIKYYAEMGGRQYISRLKYWYGHCVWRRWVFLEEKIGKWVDSTPAPEEIALACYGRVRGEKIDADSHIIKATIQRLFPCIINNMDIPNDLIKAAAAKTSQPLAYYNKKNGFFLWENYMLSVVCAMIRYQYEKKGNRNMNSFLDDNDKDRSVLFGRLLAVYDYMEELALADGDDPRNIKGIRQTNAKRYWNAYSIRPALTLKTLHENLIPYRKKLDSDKEDCFDQWIQEILKKLADNGYNNKSLSEMYLPGYYLQMDEMKKYFYVKRL